MTPRRRSPSTLPNRESDQSAEPANSPFWNSLSDQSFGAIDGPDVGTTLGDGIGETWDEAGGSDANVLSEIFLLGSSTFAAEARPCRWAAVRAGAEPPLTFQYRNSRRARCSRATSNSSPAARWTTPTFDGDGDVDGADFLAWQRGLYDDRRELAGGDVQGDGDVDADDFAVWRRQFAEVQAAAAIPERARPRYWPQSA